MGQNIFRRLGQEKSGLVNLQTLAESKEYPLDFPKCSENVEKRDHSYTAGGVSNGMATLEGSLAGSFFFFF